jgi:hypothetical protein
MKALKNDGSIYTERIATAIAECYGSGDNPSNQSLLELYTFIGQHICLQGEKAFVAHLAEILTVQFPTLKGFSLRNLRRMRDFYRTYANNPALMEKTQFLSWTQNAVILECCEIDEQRSFYIDLAAGQNLSKLALLKAITENTFAAASGTDTPAENVEPSFAPVGDILPKEAVDTAASVETACEPSVPACEPPRQGDTTPNRIGSRYTAAIAEISNGRRPKYLPDDPSPPSRIFALLKYPTPMAIQIQKQKLPQKPPPGILRPRKISAFSLSSTQDEIQQWRLCPMQIAA